MKPTRYVIDGRRVLEEVKQAPEEVRESFAALIRVLETDPYPDGGGAILPIVDFPNGFSAPFRGGLLAYQVTVDIPSVRLKYVLWDN